MNSFFLIIIKKKITKILKNYFQLFSPPLSLSLSIYLFHIYQPLRSGRIWHKVNF